MYAGGALTRASVIRDRQTLAPLRQVVHSRPSFDLRNGARALLLASAAASKNRRDNRKTEASISVRKSVRRQAEGDYYLPVRRLHCLGKHLVEHHSTLCRRYMVPVLALVGITHKPVHTERRRHAYDIVLNDGELHRYDGIVQTEVVNGTR